MTRAARKPGFRIWSFQASVPSAVLRERPRGRSLLAMLLLSAVGLPWHGASVGANPPPGQYRFEVRESTLMLWANEALLGDILVSLRNDFGVVVRGGTPHGSNVTVTCKGRSLREVLNNLDIDSVLVYEAESDPYRHQLRSVELSTSGVGGTPANRRLIRFSSGAALDWFQTKHGDAWTVEEGELVGTSGRGNDKPFLTYKTTFESLDRVVVRGRIIPPSTRNFRLSVGAVNLIFNWEVREENHYRNGSDITVQAGPALEPGVVHTIEVRQDGEEAVVRVDEREVYRTETRLKGTVTVYPAHGSRIGISEMLIEGAAAPGQAVEGHSHPNTF